MCEEKNLCPCCGSEMTFRKWYEDCWGAWMMCEWAYSCRCGYTKGWAYGSSYTEYPEGWEGEENEDM